MRAFNPPRCVHAVRSVALLFAVLGLLIAGYGCTGTEITRGSGSPTDDGDAPDGDWGPCENGESRPADDGCNTCVCDDGVWLCSEMACPDGDIPPDGDGSDGDEPDGDRPDGDAPDGDAPDGDAPDGDAPDGDLPDGDLPDGDLPDGDLPDGDVPDGDEVDLCPGVECGPCNVCDPPTGACVCTGACETEVYCDGFDDDCNGQTDEGGVCVNRGLRIELSWSRSEADMDLHLLRPRGVFGLGNYVDYHDAYYGNPAPDWGIPGNTTDDPAYQGDVTTGSGEDRNPETILLLNPAPHSLRVLVHYARRSGIGGQQSTAWVKIWMDGQLKETFVVNFERANTFWNVACINYAAKTVSAIRTSNNQPELSEGDVTRLNAQACLSIGAACTSVCDCPGGAGCIDSVCQPTDVSPPPCCGNWGCAAGLVCEDHRGEPGLCGSYLNFDKDPADRAISAGSSVATLYLPWGVQFSTPRANSVVSADAYRIAEGNSCSTRDSDGTRWRGNIHVGLFIPGEADAQPVRAETRHAAFLVGDTRVQNGLRVSAYSAAGVKVAEQTVSGSTFASGTHTVRVVSYLPFHSLRIETAQDPDFVIDNLQIGPLKAVR